MQRKKHKEENALNLTIWEICLYGAYVVAGLAALLITGLLIFGKDKVKSGGYLRILFAAVFLCALILGFPPALYKYSEHGFGFFKSVAISFLAAIEVFGVEDLHKSVIETYSSAPEAVRAIYLDTVMAIQFAAPVLSLSFILSFFKNLVAGVEYKLSFMRKIHVFSELNEKTAALAANIKKDGEKLAFFARPLIVFTDVPESNDKLPELKEKARKAGALLFKKDLDAIKFIGRVPRKINFYLIGENEHEKLRHANHIIRNYDNDGVSVYVFSDDMRSALMLSATDAQRAKVYRVNDRQSLVYHNLDVYGTRLLSKAKDNDKVVSAVIVGLGSYGLETLKGLLWYCQMPGYSVKINLFDKDKDTEKRLCGLCPGLMKGAGGKSQLDARYDITVHSGVDAFSSDFEERMAQIGDVTYVFISLGEDNRNISAAVKVRNICNAHGKESADIETVVYDADISHTMSCEWQGDESSGGAKNFRGQGYNIHMIGDLESFYTVGTVIDSGLERSGLAIHLGYNKGTPYEQAVESFYRFEYNYRSSLAKAIHDKAITTLAANGELCELLDADLADFESLPCEKKVEIAAVEHSRWNAYMITEGYIYGENKDFLAKTHPELKPTNELSEKSINNNADEVVDTIKSFIKE